MYIGGLIIIRILISNGDGVNAKGLDVLTKVMQNFGEVIVVAPDRERSGHGHLMDEPLSTLDAELRIEMRREIQRLHQITKASIVYVTHDQGEALAMADRIVVMNKGRIEQIGTPEEIYYYPKTEFVATFVSKANLFKGSWDGDKFYLNNGPYVWDNIGTSELLKEEGLYSIRPEQIQLVENESNLLTGEIKTKQFQGKEYHYSLEVGGNIILVQRPIVESFEVGDVVGINPIA